MKLKDVKPGEKFYFTRIPSNCPSIFTMLEDAGVFKYLYIDSKFRLCSAPENEEVKLVEPAE